jgi:diaminohydroxyphosphoribosylaminopyrimidine deaminase / 5-amino-6-(5-phosphoribosylamino)uracil reductase
VNGEDAARGGAQGGERPGADRLGERDRRAMSRALALAARGLDSTHPNPRVGCVIVQGERTVGEGWHEWAGEAHAEVAALRAAGAEAAGATAYVTLEPCSHHGRTPPCADALIEARVSRVVFAMHDPDPRVSGRGAERLRRAGIRAECGLMGREAAELNAGYVRRLTAGRPWVRVKLALSLDGRTALASGASKWITGEDARDDVQRWRARSSALMTGINTVLADDPRLDVRIEAERVRQPVRVVLDSALRTPPGARLFGGVGEVWIFTGTADAARRGALAARGARIEQVEQVEQAERAAGIGGGTARLDLRRVLERLAEAQINEVHVEAGATLAGELIRTRLADELLLYVAPVLFGPQARPLVDLPALASLQGAPRFDIVDVQPVGADLRIRLRPAGPAPAGEAAPLAADATPIAPGAGREART